LDSSSSLILPERSLVGRALGDRREMGLKAAYKTPLWNVASMISTGRAIYGTGTGTFNDLHARVELTPVKDLSYGAFATLGNGLDYSKKGRWGVNARYSISGAVLRAEYAQAKDAAVQSRGLTTEVGYFVTPRFQPVIRYEMFSPNQAATTATTLAQAETIGVNYLLPEYNMKLQLSGSALQNLADPNGTPALSKGVHNAEVTMAVQGTL
jgi:predicted porin